jgi:hypothetical protein
LRLIIQISHHPAFSIEELVIALFKTTASKTSISGSPWSSSGLAGHLHGAMPMK